jgi:hypothetical protein
VLKAGDDTIAQKEETTCKYCVCEPPHVIPERDEDEGKRRERVP